VYIINSHIQSNAQKSGRSSDNDRRKSLLTGHFFTLPEQVGKLSSLTKFIAAAFFLPAKIVKTEVKTTKT
jgi:hypothetical protein